MRKLVVSEFLSLDGVMEAPGGDDGYVHGAWTMPYFCDEIGAFKSSELEAAGGLLLGRVTYEGFAAAWPTRTGDVFSDRMNSIPKHVVSSTLTDPAWQGTSVVSGDLREAVAELAGSGEGDFLVAGSAKLVQGLLEAGLVDELRLATYPVLLGVGKRLFPLGVRLDFELAETTTTRTGVVLATYRRPSGDGPAGDPHPFADR